MGEGGGESTVTISRHYPKENKQWVENTKANKMSKFCTMDARDTMGRDGTLYWKDEMGGEEGERGDI